jgi:hypothetical protein
MMIFKKQKNVFSVTKMKVPVIFLVLNEFCYSGWIVEGDKNSLVLCFTC